MLSVHARVCTHLSASGFKFNDQNVTAASEQEIDAASGSVGGAGGATAYMCLYRRKGAGTEEEEQALAVELPDGMRELIKSQSSDVADGGDGSTAATLPTAQATASSAGSTAFAAWKAVTAAGGGTGNSVVSGERCGSAAGMETATATSVKGAADGVSAAATTPPPSTSATLDEFDYIAPQHRASFAATSSVLPLETPDDNDSSMATGAALPLSNTAGGANTEGTTTGCAPVAVAEPAPSSPSSKPAPRPERGLKIGRRAA